MSALRSSFGSQLVTGSVVAAAFDTNVTCLETFGRQISFYGLSTVYREALVVAGSADFVGVTTMVYALNFFRILDYGSNFVEFHFFFGVQGRLVEVEVNSALFFRELREHSVLYATAFIGIRFHLVITQLPSC